MTRSFVAPEDVPRYPELVEIETVPDEGGEPSFHTEVHPFAGQIDGNALQDLIGDGVWIGEGSKWALPWEYGTGPCAIPGGQMTVQTTDVPPIPSIPSAPQYTQVGDLVDPAFAGKPGVNAREDMNRALRLVIRYGSDQYPSMTEIRNELNGKTLVDSVPLAEASHADVLVVIAAGEKP